MQFTQLHRTKFTQWFVLLFYTLAAYKWFNGMWLYQFNPTIFTTRFDGITWLFMQTGLHKFVAKNSVAPLLFDVGFYIMPALYYFAYTKNGKLAQCLAAIMFLVNWVYVQTYTLFPTNSIEGHVVWLLFPLMLITGNLKSFYFLMHGARYFFLYFFLSAGIWKIVQGGLFNPIQMSAILLNQHKELLVSTPNNWLSNFYYWLINHSAISYILYFTAFLMELSFVMGFFTKKYDKLLCIFFIAFLVFNHFIMRIPYYEVIPLMLPMFFSHFKMPENNYNRMKY